MKAKVLIVEDSREQREHLMRQMASRGYDVQSVSGGIEALRAIRSDPPDVVILDVLLDELDGHGVCRWVRLTESTRDIIVIMVTVKTHVRERIEGLHMGADDYLPKPYDADELEARIHAAMRSRGARQELRKRNIELETLLARTEHVISADPLTGVMSKHRFIEEGKRQLAFSQRYKIPLACAKLDLDRFKRVNDAGGNGVGDAVLVEIARIMRANVREVDTCARWEGDEFALLLPHTTMEGAVVVLERIRRRIFDARASWPGAEHLSVSAGIASTEDPTIMEGPELLSAADRALYRAKRLGRDRVVVATNDDRSGE